VVRQAFVKFGYSALRAGLRLPEVPWVRRFSEEGHLIDLLNSLRINYVLDVGANKGWFAKHLRMMGYKGYIFCFEPISADCTLILQAAGTDPAWRVFNFALGPENTTKQFNIISLRGSDTASSSFLEPNFGETENVRIKSESIAVRRMDDVLDEIVTPDDIETARIFLKIDTQGYDMEVLRGCVRWLDKVCALQSEISITPIYNGMPHYTKALDNYESLGFTLIDLKVVNRFQHRSIVEYDCVMARLDRFDQR
jgi:FkbM family methyltransferase